MKRCLCRIVLKDADALFGKTVSGTAMIPYVEKPPEISAIFICS